jgi:hypothetical protein
VSPARGPLEQARPVAATRTSDAAASIGLSMSPIEDGEVVQALSVWWQPWVIGRRPKPRPPRRAMWPGCHSIGMKATAAEAGAQISTLESAIKARRGDFVGRGPQYSSPSAWRPLGENNGHETQGR